MPSSDLRDPTLTYVSNWPVAITIIVGLVPTIFAFALLWTLEVQTWAIWAMLAVGLTFTMLAATYMIQRQRTQQALQASERHYRELTERAADAVALITVSKALRTAATRDEMLRIILDQLQSILPAEGVAFARRDLAQKDIVIEMGRGVWEGLTGQRLPSGGVMGGLVLDTTQPYVVDDLRLDSLLKASEPHNNLTAAASVPLIAQQETLGVFWAGRKEPFSRESMGLMTAIANIAANAFHRMQLYEETRHHAGQLAAVNASGRALAELLDLHQIYERLPAAILELLTDIVVVLIFLYDQEQHTIACAYGVRDNAPLSEEELPPMPRSASGEDELSQVIRSRRPLIVSDLPATPSENTAHGQAGNTGPRTQSALYVPMLTRGEVLGVMQVQSYLPHRFDEGDAELLSTIANMAAVTLQNARLFQELQTSNADLARRVEERTADLSAANAELARAARLKDEFLASMSHELRTPLNGILVFTESLLEQMRGPLNDYQIESLRNVETSGRHLLALINDILDLSKIEAGKLELQMDMILAEEVCQASLMFVKEVATKKHLGLVFKLDHPQMNLLADPRRLKQILVNLLSNAVKFTPEGGQVVLDVRTNVGEDVIHFAVQDTGIGIAPDDLSRLFQPFAQLDSRLSRQHGGTGLGLALVRRLAEAHGGGVSVESEVGRGSRFTVSLPWRDSLRLDVATGLSTAHPALITTLDAPLVPKTSGALILLAEDNEINIRATGDYLQDKGYRIVVARNGEEALERAREMKPDLILMDIQMPEMDGLEATRRLRAESALAATPVIALTALAMPGDRERCLAAGATDYMTKPVSMKGLARTIEKLLKR